jgi:hypothetical protein
MRPLRNSSEEGDIIIAFSDPHIKESPFRLLYLWVVEQKLRPIDYYDKPISAGREDNIYEMINGQFERKPAALWKKISRRLTSTVGGCTETGTRGNTRKAISVRHVARNVPPEKE